jgi:N-acetylglucosamine-6-phosphate deacetylase
MLCLHNARVVLPDEVMPGYVLVEDGRLFDVCEGAPRSLPEGTQRIDLGGMYLAPGFVDLHTHGAGGCDFLDGTAQAFERACRTHMEHGTTCLMPTAVAATKEEMLRCVEAFRRARTPVRLPGLHMEGPYLNASQKGAIDERYIRNPSPDEYESILDAADGAIARWTVAPELDGALEFGRRLRRRGILPSIGHTAAEYARVKEAFDAGFTHITHLYSAMSTIVRRSGFRYPGVIESVYILEDMTVEIIADGCHLPPEMLRMVWRLKGKEKVALVCDSIRCAGQDVTESVIGSVENGMRVIIEDDVAKLPDRSAFAGSIATDDRLVRTMIQKAGVPVADSVRMMTLTPAQIAGLSDKIGSIARGKRADLVCFDDDVRVRGVMINGKGTTGLFLGAKGGIR